MIRIGVAGWDYPDWVGVVYPKSSGRAFDRLAFLARFVDLIEINSTFYRPVLPRQAIAWLRRVEDRPEFVFTAKAHRSWTHAGDAGHGPEIVETLSGLQPLLQAGRLGALLLQFPQSFHFTPAATSHLERLLRRVSGWPVVIEVRHASWEEREAVAWFAECGAAWCAIDQPRIGRQTARLDPRVLGRLGYLRLHGRNAPDWFRDDAGRDARYDYLYSEQELRELSGVANRMRQVAEQLFIVQNNHFRGKALVNALQLRRLVEGEPPLAPADLISAYPELAPMVRAESGLLF